MSSVGTISKQKSPPCVSGPAATYNTVDPTDASSSLWFIVAGGITPNPINCDPTTHPSNSWFTRSNKSPLQKTPQRHFHITGHSTVNSTCDYRRRYSLTTANVFHPEYVHWCLLEWGPVSGHFTNVSLPAPGVSCVLYTAIRCLEVSPNGTGLSLFEVPHTVRTAGQSFFHFAWYERFLRKVRFCWCEAALLMASGYEPSYMNIIIGPLGFGSYYKTSWSVGPCIHCCDLPVSTGKQSPEVLSLGGSSTDTAGPLPGGSV